MGDFPLVEMSWGSVRIVGDSQVRSPFERIFTDAKHPALTTLRTRPELAWGRCLLSGTTHHGAHLAAMTMKSPTEVMLMPTGGYNKMGKLVSVHLMAMVSSTSGAMPTGKVTFEMVMPAGMSMGGMKGGTTILGTGTLHKGNATLTVKPKFAVNMPLEIIYHGNSHFQASKVTPPTVTTTGLMSSSMSGGMKMPM
jgi:hypothetical protein